MAAALVESLGLMDVQDLMSGLKVPVLVLHREGDFIPAADARTVAAAIPGATLQQRAAVLLAANQTVRAATDAVDRVFRLAGADAVFACHPLQRCLRDVHAAGQHILFSSDRDQAYAKVRLGIDQPTYLI